MIDRIQEFLDDLVYCHIPVVLARLRIRGRYCKRHDWIIDKPYDACLLCRPELVSTVYLPRDTEPFTFLNGRAWVHNEKVCEADRACVIHRPSDHRMRDLPMLLRETGLVERICGHGVGHPDPDSAAYYDRAGPVGSRGTWSVHGCDGCCFA